jgi:hypothetical protein
MKVTPWLRVEWRNKDVKGQKQAEEDAERFIMSRDNYVWRLEDSTRRPADRAGQTSAPALS